VNLGSLSNTRAKLTSEYAKKILDNFEGEIKNFYQVCPKEMLDKLDNPITLKSVKSFAS
jgi:hypothetical protein